MAIDPLNTWQRELDNLPLVGDNSWAKNFSDWYADRIENITPDQTKLNTQSGFVFLFNRVLFVSELQKLTPVDSALAGITNFANAWEKTIKTIVYPISIAVSPGAFVGSPSPPTLFSTITSVKLDADSILKGKTKILELVNASTVDSAILSQFAIKFREATLLLTISVEGMNSITPTPTPLQASKIPLV